MNYPEAETITPLEPQVVSEDLVAQIAAFEAVLPDEHAEPAFLPPSPNFRRGWVSGASLVSAVVCAGTLMTVTAQRDPLVASSAPGEAAPAEDPARLQVFAGVPEFVGPPKPALSPSAPNALEMAVQQMAGTGGRRALPGGLGYFGPVEGPLNTSLAGVGPVRGPLWRGAPLPGVGGFGLFPEGPPIASAPEQPAGPTAQLPGGPQAGSELPDPSKLALARLANPHVAGAKPASAQAVPTPVSPEKPLGVTLSAARPSRGYEPGATVAVRGSTSGADAYFVLIGVNGEGEASTLFRSSRPARSFAYAIRAQSSPGPQYLVLVAAAHPLTGGDVAAAMRASGQGFLAPVMTIHTAGGQPGAAWSAALAQAGSLGGGTKGWKRHEWSVAATSFFTRPPDKVAVQKPAAEKPPVKPDTTKPQESEGSVLPGARPEPLKGEKSAMPAVKPEGAQPKSPMALPEPAKPAAKADGASGDRPE